MKEIVDLVDLKSRAHESNGEKREAFFLKLDFHGYLSFWEAFFSKLLSRLEIFDRHFCFSSCTFESLCHFALYLIGYQLRPFDSFIHSASAFKCLSRRSNIMLRFFRLFSVHTRLGRGVFPIQINKVIL